MLVEIFLECGILYIALRHLNRAFQVVGRLLLQCLFEDLCVVLRQDQVHEFHPRLNDDLYIDFDLVAFHLTRLDL